MKKTILILLILITTSTYAFAENTPDCIKNNTLPDNLPIPLPDILSNTLSDKAKDTVFDKIKETVPEKAKDILPDKVSEINLISDDEQKVKEWAKFNSTENYVIINKKNCSAAVYDKEGNKIKRFEIGVGRDIGDDFNDTSGLLGKSKNTTPAGEFTLKTNIFNKEAYGDLTLSLGKEANKTPKAKNVVALHKIPTFRMKARRDKFYDGDLANNRMSHGCINFIEKDFNELKKYIRGGLKTYILPEEEGNHLILKKNDQNGFEFTQTKYSGWASKYKTDNSKNSLNSES